MPETRLGILLSGRGSNFLAIQSTIEAGVLPARIAVVLSNRSKAPGLERAKELGLSARALPPRPGETREGHETRVIAALRESEVDWVCLAGYMRLLSSSFVRAFPQRIVNIHPSLLPSFPGLDAQRQAFDHGVRVAGCTVHLVDEGLDSGPIIEQRAVRVADGDTEDSLAARILEQEHKAYPAALRRLLVEPWDVVGRRVVFKG